MSIFYIESRWNKSNRPTGCRCFYNDPLKFKVCTRCKIDAKCFILTKCEFSKDFKLQPAMLPSIPKKVKTDKKPEQCYCCKKLTYQTHLIRFNSRLKEKPLCEECIKFRLDPEFTIKDITYKRLLPGALPNLSLNKVLKLVTAIKQVNLK